MDNLIRRGLLALPAAGVLTAVPWLFMLGNSSSAKSDPEGYARYLTSASHLVAGNLYLAGLICLLFGLLAFYGYLTRSGASSWAAAGMIVSVVGIAVALPVFGVLGLANTVLADVYLAGHKDVSAAMLTLTGGDALSNRIIAYLTVVLVISLIGAIANTVAVWQSGSLPKWSGVLMATGFLLSMTFTPFIAWIGALCLVVGGVWLATSAGQAPTGTTVAGRPQKAGVGV
jgi:hypothetical protein